MHWCASLEYSPARQECRNDRYTHTVLCCVLCCAVQLTICERNALLQGGPPPAFPEEIRILAKPGQVSDELCLLSRSIASDSAPHTVHCNTATAPSGTNANSLGARAHMVHKAGGVGGTIAQAVMFDSFCFHRGSANTTADRHRRSVCSHHPHFRPEPAAPPLDPLSTPGGWWLV